MSVLFAMFGLGHMELLIVAAIILLLFGHRLPSMMRSMGRGIKEFKAGVNDPLERDEETTNVGAKDRVED